MNKGHQFESRLNRTLSLKRLAGWRKGDRTVSYQCKKTLLCKWHLWLPGISSVHFQTGSLYSRDCSDHCGRIKMKGRTIKEFFLKKYEHDKASKNTFIGKRSTASWRLTHWFKTIALAAPSHNHLSTHPLTLHFPKVKACRKYNVLR